MRTAAFGHQEGYVVEDDTDTDTDSERDPVDEEEAIGAWQDDDDDDDDFEYTGESVSPLFPYSRFTICRRTPDTSHTRHAHTHTHHTTPHSPSPALVSCVHPRRRAPF